MNRTTMTSFFANPAVKWGLGAALVVFAALLPMLNISIPGVLPGPTYTAGSLQLLAFAMLIAALALTYHLVFGVAGLLSFGHALFFAAGAYGFGIALRHLEMEMLPAILFTIVIGIIIASLVGALSLRATGVAFAMVTLAFAQAGSVVIRRNPNGLTNGDEGLALATTFIPDELVGVVNTKNLYWVCLGVLVVIFLITSLFERSRAGHVAAATRENPIRVRVLGMRPYIVQLITFVLAGTLATIVGIAYMLLQSSATQKIAAPEWTISLLVIVVLGGVGLRWGAVIGGLIYTLLDQRLTALASSDAVAGLPAFLRIPLSEPLFILGTLFILVVLFLPGGIAGTAQRLAQRRGSVAQERDALEERTVREEVR